MRRWLNGVLALALVAAGCDDGASGTTADAGAGGGTGGATGGAGGEAGGTGGETGGTGGETGGTGGTGGEIGGGTGGATGGTGGDCAAGCEVGSEKARDLAPDVAEADLQKLVDAQNAFAFDLYGRLKLEADGDLFFSPFSIQQAFAMLYAGARGETASQMATVFHWDALGDALHPAENALDLALASRAVPADPDEEGQPLRLEIANSLWGAKEAEFVPAFLDVLAESYGAVLRVLDFAHAPEAARATINHWTSDRTQGLIPEILPAGSVDELTRLVLVNALYFKASWQFPFEENGTADADFHHLDGTTAPLPLMTVDAEIPYVDAEDYEALALPYVGQTTSMLVLAPKTGQFEAVEGTLSVETLAGVVEALQHTHVALRFPKMQVKQATSLPNVLTAMGMPLVFDDGADLTGIEDFPMHVTGAFHQAVVKLDEAGTEAAAATAIVVGNDSEPPPAIAVVIDRPFIFAIRDDVTGALLFLGRYLGP